MEQYRFETSKGCSIAKTETTSSQHRLWLTPIIIRASRYGVWSSALVMAPLTSKGNWKGCYWWYRYCSRYHPSADMLFFLLAWVFLYCSWYQLLYMLLLLLMHMDYLLDRTQKRLDLIGLASGGGSNSHSTVSSQLRCVGIYALKPHN